jgi:hypothetical protein
MNTEELPGAGEWVRFLQELLEQAGYWNDERGEEYTPTLKEAVSRFQHDHDLEGGGVLSGATWASLTEATDTEPHDLHIDWQGDYPEIYHVATARDFAEYLHRVVEIDPETFDRELE